MRHPPVPAPLLWHCWLAAWGLGSLAALWFWQSAFCLFLVMIFAVAGKPVSIFNTTIRVCLGLGIFALAMSMTRNDLQSSPQDPDAQLRASASMATDIRSASLAGNHEPNGKTGKKNGGQRSRTRVCATVYHVQSLPDQRLRVLLEKARQYHEEKASTCPPGAGNGLSTEGQSLPGLIAWTWEKPAFRPLPGQMVCFSKDPKPLSGFANHDLPEWNTNLRLRGVQWRVWSRGEDGSPVIAGNSHKDSDEPGLAQASKMASLRQGLVDRVASLAGLPVLPEKPGAAGNMMSGSSPVCSGNSYKARAILPALLFGERFWLSNQTVDQFAAASLAHSLALSGQHLAIAWLAAVFIVAVIVRLWPGIYLLMPRPAITMLMACPLAAIYLWLGNAPWSLLRSGAMLAVLAICICLRQNKSLTDILAIALVCLLVVSPGAILDTGLQLSLLCVTVIAVCLPWLKRLRNRLLARPGRDWPSRMAFASLSILGISLAIQIFLLPLNILLFGNPGFYFALNLVWLPIIGLWLLPLAFAGLLLACPGLVLAHVWPGVADLTSLFDTASGSCLWLASRPAELLLGLLGWLDAAGLLSAPAIMRPHWTALPAFALLLLAMACLAACQQHGRQGWSPLPGRIRTARIILGLAIVLLAIGPICRLVQRIDASLRLDVLDVGLGQALVLHSPGGQRILVDAGGSASPRFDPGKAIVAPALLVNQGPDLTAIINSHPDMDHAGGIFYLNKHFRTGPLFHNGRPADGKKTKDWASLMDLPKAGILAAGDMVILDNEPNDGQGPGHGHHGDRGVESGSEHGDANVIKWHFAPLAGNGQLWLEVLHPPRDAQSGQWTDNGASLVLRLVRNGKGLALLTGDADQAALRYLLAQNRAKGLDLTAEVLLAPHHGSDKNFVPELYRAVRPALVVASCGANNRYNYPGKRLGAWLAQNGIPLLDTGHNGQIRISWAKDGKMNTEWARQEQMK